MSDATFKSVLAIALTAVLVVVSIDLEIKHLSPYTHAREAIDGLEDLKESDPTVLVVGSSYARTFNVLARELFKASSGKQRLVDVPLEGGKLTSYAWMLDHRIAPILRESKKPSLRRFVIVTEWWDSCYNDKSGNNIPGRLWKSSEFALSVLSEGLSSYNRNYLQYNWRRLFSDSALVQYRGAFEPIRLAERRLFGLPTGPTHDPRTVAAFYKDGIAGAKCIGNPGEMAALEHLLEFAEERGLESVIVLFPFMPAMESPEARATTYTLFFDMAKALALRYRARVVDLVTPSPLTDEDWLPDCEHLNPVGNAKFASWTLHGPLSFLLDDPITASKRP